jgi:hypothetical protein
MLVLACCNDAGQFLPPVLTFKGVDKRQEVFSKSFTEHFLKHIMSAKVILSLDGRRAKCSSHFLLQTAVENNVLSCVFPVIVLATYSLRVIDFLAL